MTALRGRPPRRANADPGRSASGAAGKQASHKNTPRPSRPQYAVMCVKHDGKRIEFQRYDDEARAESVAAHLRTVGCLAEVRKVRGAR